MSDFKQILKDIYKLSLNTHKRDAGQMTIALSNIVNDLRPYDQKIEDLQEQLEQSKNEAERLALAIYNRHYKSESPEFELCDSVTGVISQIDNMSAGLSEQLEQKDKKIIELAKSDAHTTSMLFKLQARNEKLERVVEAVNQYDMKGYYWIVKALDQLNEVDDE